MIEILLSVILVILLINLWLLFQKVRTDNPRQMEQIKSAIDKFDGDLDKMDKSIQDDFQRNREESNKIAKENREEVSNTLKSFSDTFSGNVKDFNKTTGEKLEIVRQTVENKLQAIQNDNNQKLEKMRETVDEKLHRTLEQRLGESFKIVSERLKEVHEGLGAMQSLATGVGDLKKVLTNVKTKGIFGEYQLENILEHLLTADQYSKNVKTKPDSDAFVEFAIRLPSKKEEDKIVWLPIDSKFPTENYHQLMEAYDQGDVAAIEIAQKQMKRTVKTFAHEIREKYVEPPFTTDFAIMFLPIEGLYAEVLRDPQLFDLLQREYRIVITGPTTLSALLNSLQMGFRTLAIEKRSSEVWELLGAIKTEFGKFGDILDKTKKKLQEASNVVESAGTRSRVIERKLKDVEQLPTRETPKYLDTVEES
jgi:DNA recombination protein RmuC